VKLTPGIARDNIAFENVLSFSSEIDGKKESKSDNPIKVKVSSTLACSILSSSVKVFSHKKLKNLINFFGTL